MSVVSLRTWYYRQFDADPARDVPAEGYGGWQNAPLELDLARTAVVLMHAWQFGSATEYPGLHRAEEYIPRSDAICRDVLPPLLTAVRASTVPMVHVAFPSYAARCPGYGRALALAGPEPKGPEPVQPGLVAERLHRFRLDHVYPGAHNRADIDRWWQQVDFPAEARPVGDEWVVTSSPQLLALCRHLGVDHLVYAGFAINWCLLMLPCGMVDMSRHGLQCSALRQAVTAVESRESARGERYKEEGLWRVSVAFGFVYDVADFAAALHSSFPAQGVE